MISQGFVRGSQHVKASDNLYCCPNANRDSVNRYSSLTGHASWEEQCPETASLLPDTLWFVHRMRWSGETCKLVEIRIETCHL